MAKNLNFKSGAVTTDEDWYEIDAWGARNGKRHFNGVEGDMGQASGSGAAPPLAGGGAGGDTPSSSLAGIEAATGGMGLEAGGEGFGMMQPGALKPGLGRRQYPQDAGPLAGINRIY
jgi:hypothetical protein